MNEDIAYARNTESGCKLHVFDIFQVKHKILSFAPKLCWVRIFKSLFQPQSLHASVIVFLPFSGRQSHV